jgi:hypothetical protein
MASSHLARSPSVVLLLHSSRTDYLVIQAASSVYGAVVDFSRSKGQAYSASRLRIPEC